MLVLGIGHLFLLALASWEDITGWVEEGMWAAVPLDLTDGGAAATVESQQNALTFWAGPGSFAVPLLLLGCLTWHLAGRGVAVPAGFGWGIVVWCVLGGVLLVPSPFFAGILAGALIIIAARKEDRSGAAPSSAEGHVPDLDSSRTTPE